MAPARDDQQPNDEPTGRRDGPQIFQTGLPAAEAQTPDPGDNEPEIWRQGGAGDDVVIDRSSDGTEVVGGSSPTEPPPEP